MEVDNTWIFHNQNGYGMSDIGPLYYSYPLHYQYGRGGVGSFFSGVFKYLKPLITSGLQALRKQSIKTGVDVLSNLGDKPIKTVLVEQGKKAVEELAQKGIKKLKKIQEGNGTSHSFAFRQKKPIKRRSLVLDPHSANPSKKRKITDRITKKFSFKNNKKKKKIEVDDIFS